MYRIHFDPKIGMFLVQIASGLFGIFWTTVGRELNGVAGEKSPVWNSLRFATFKEAKEYAASIGLDQLYEDRSANHYRAHMGR